jgi:DNA-binding SARP family transcriptional activator
MEGIEVSVLGPLAIAFAGVPAELTGAKPRSLVTALALHANSVADVGTLIDCLWGDDAPDRAEHTLQQHVSSTRKQLAAAAGSPEGGQVLQTQSPGYLLRVTSLDAGDFEHHLGAAHQLAAAGRWDDALAAYDAALALWRGPALADVRSTPTLESHAVRLDEQRLGAVEGRCEARLSCGQAREVVAELEHLVARHPLRERLRSQLMLALYRTGRQADALAVYRQGREVLIEELGIEPGPELRALEQAILEQRTDLELPTAATAVVDEPDPRATFRAGIQLDRGRLEFADGQTVRLVDGRVDIGRDPSCVVRLVDNRVSRRHAELDISADACTLRDLGSTNGTTVNDEAVDQRVLADGDRIAFGGVPLTYRRPGPLDA